MRPRARRRARRSSSRRRASRATRSAGASSRTRRFRCSPGWESKKSLERTEPETITRFPTRAARRHRRGGAASNACDVDFDGASGFPRGRCRRARGRARCDSAPPSCPSKEISGRGFASGASTGSWARARPWAHGDVTARWTAASAARSFEENLPCSDSERCSREKASTSQTAPFCISSKGDMWGSPASKGAASTSRRSRRSRVAQSAHHDFDSLLDRLCARKPGPRGRSRGVDPAHGAASCLGAGLPGRARRACGRRPLRGRRRRRHRPVHGHRNVARAALRRGRGRAARRFPRGDSRRRRPSPTLIFAATARSRAGVSSSRACSAPSSPAASRRASSLRRRRRSHAGRRAPRGSDQRRFAAFFRAVSRRRFRLARFFPAFGKRPVRIVSIWARWMRSWPA